MKKYGLFFIIVTFISTIGYCAETKNNAEIPTEGLAAEGNGHWQKAVDIYLDVLLKQPNRVDLWLRVAEIEHRLKQDNLTIAAYEHAIAAQPQNPTLHKKLSEIYAGLNQPQRAMQQIEAAVKLEPNNIEYIESFANIANWNKQPNIALQNYQRLATLNAYEFNKPKQIQLLMQIAQLQQELRHDDEALITYQALIKIAPDNTTATFWIKKYSEGKKQIVIQQPKPLPLFDQYLNNSNKEASTHHYAEAIKLLKKAAAIKKNQAELYQKISALYAMSKQPNPALHYINQALRYEPNHLSYLRAKGKLASWALHLNEALSAYNKILMLKPYDEEAMLNRAHTLATMGETDKALKTYSELLRRYPNNAQGWIYYAEALTWVERYPKAMNALFHYGQLKGEDVNYNKTKARIYALDGWYQSSRRMNEPILQKYPKDTYALKTEVLALKKAFQMENALYFLRKLNRWAKDDPKINQFNALIRTPLRSNINLRGDYTWASDTTAVLDIPISLQYFTSPTTSILLQGLYERLTAKVNSGLETIDGKGSIFNDSARVGVSTQFAKMNLSALVGGLHIQNGSNFAIYDATLDTNLNEKLEITVDSMHDLFRPYLVPQTPREVSLQIMEQRTGLLLQWQPLMQKYVYLLTSFSTLSDHNNYWHTNIWPKTRVFGSQHWLVNLGVDADLWSFARRAHNGYYSPLFFQEYEGTIEVYHGFTENIGLSLAGGFGVQKDETLNHFYYAEDLNGRLIYGILDDIQIQLRGGYTLRANSIRNYQCRVVSLVFTKRFQ